MNIDNAVDISSENNAINFNHAIPINKIRLSIDAITLNINLPPEMIKKIQKFVDDIKKHVNDPSGKYKTPFHPYLRRFYTTGFRAFLNELLAYEPTLATAFTCLSGSNRPGSKNTLFHWNPGKCESAIVAGLIFNDYLDIPSSCLMHSTISSIHLAVDVPKVKIDELAFSYPKMQAVENQFSNGQTQYLGVKKGKTRVRVYDKRAQIIYLNGKIGMYLADIKEKVPADDLLRIEIELKPMSMLDHALPMGLMELYQLPNVMSKLRVHAMPPNLLRVERLALRLARYEGLVTAISAAQMNPAEKKTFLTKLKNCGTPSWWNPTEMWAQQFVPLIDKFLKPLIPALEQHVPQYAAFPLHGQLVDEPVTP